MLSTTLSSGPSVAEVAGAGAVFLTFRDVDLRRIGSGLSSGVRALSIGGLGLRRERIPCGGAEAIADSVAAYC